MTKTTILTEKAPAAVGPYSQAVAIDQLIFTSGQIGIHPLTGQLRPGIVEQTHQVLQNLAAVLDAAGSGMHRIVKTTIFLTDIAEFSTVNEIYRGGVPRRSSCTQYRASCRVAARRAD